MSAVSVSIMTMDMHQKTGEVVPELMKAANLAKFPALLEDQLDDLVERQLANSGRVVNRLPQAILACILRYVRESSSLSSETPLFWLMQICHHWRQVIWNEPSLWTRVNISISKSASAEKQLALHLDRSQKLPLALHISLGHRVALGFGTKLVELIHHYAFRIRTFAIRGAPPETLFTLFVKAMPVLEELFIEAKPSAEYIDDSSSMLFLPSMIDGHLRRVDIRNTSTWRFSLRGLNRTLLTDLRLSQAVSMKATWAFLKQCISLERLHWTTSTTDSWTPKTTLHLSSLKTLILQGKITSYSQAIRAVNLRHLSITHVASDEPPKISTSPHLRTAIINAPSLSLPVLDDFVLRHPCLESLALMYMGNDEQKKSKWAWDVAALPASVLSRTLTHHLPLRHLYLTSYDVNHPLLLSATPHMDTGLVNAIKRIVTEHTGITGRLRDDMFDVFLVCGDEPGHPQWEKAKDLATEFDKTVKMESHGDFIKAFKELLQEDD